MKRLRTLLKSAVAAKSDRMALNAASALLDGCMRSGGRAFLAPHAEGLCTYCARAVLVKSSGGWLFEGCPEVVRRLSGGEGGCLEALGLVEGEQF